MAKKEQKPKVQLVVPELEVERIVVPLVGVAPLVCHAWSEKAVALMLGKQTGLSFEVREPKDPEHQFERSLYRLDDGRYGFPAAAIKSCIVNAAVDISSVSKALLRRSIFVVPDGKETRVFTFTGLKGAKAKKGRKRLVKEFRQEVTIDLVALNGEPTMDMSFVRLSGVGRTADVRFRGRFDQWSLDVEIEYVADMLNPEKVVRLLQRGGRTIGIGEGRPERSTDMNWGRFEVRRKKEAV